MLFFKLFKLIPGELELDFDSGHFRVGLDAEPLLRLEHDSRFLDTTIGIRHDRQSPSGY